MPDRENVIGGLEWILQDDRFGFGVNWDTTDCEPKTEEEQAGYNIQRAIELLKEQEPRVMTLDELTEIYVEFKGNNCPIRLTNFDLQKIIMFMDDGICRLWMGEPTDEQMEAVKWE